MRGLCRPSAQLLDEGALGRPGRGVLAPRDLHGQERGARGWHWIAAALPSIRGGVVAKIMRPCRSYSPPSEKGLPEASVRLTHGACDVSIPRDHRMGELESSSKFRFETRWNHAKHVVVFERFQRRLTSSSRSCRNGRFRVEMAAISQVGKKARPESPDDLGQRFDAQNAHYPACS